MSMKDIEKRKPEYASANFWGGKAKEWKNGGKVEVEKEGWLDEMCRKTLIREVYSPKHILLDPRKVDESYQYMRQRESELQRAQDDMQQVIDVSANAVPLEETPAEIAPQPQELPQPAPKSEKRNDAPKPAPVRAEEPQPAVPAPEPQGAPAAPDGDMYAGMDF